MVGPAFKEMETEETKLAVVSKPVNSGKVRAEIRETTVQATVVAAATEKMLGPYAKYCPEIMEGLKAAQRPKNIADVQIAMG
ncbi:TPA: hypothetical protein HA238_03160 [Candidatus Micrarchaeota archaeon]|nr:hypothetical protein [Candidatus Micrarchaeota archaeon]